MSALGRKRSFAKVLCPRRSLRVLAKRSGRLGPNLTVVGTIALPDRAIAVIDQPLLVAAVVRLGDDIFR